MSVQGATLQSSTFRFGKNIEGEEKLARKNVDRFVASRSFVIAIGWSEGDTPKIALNGQIMSIQQATRFFRTDVASHLGKEDKTGFGFKVIALIPSDCPPAPVYSLVFPDVAVVLHEKNHGENRVDDIFQRFIKLVECHSGDTSVIELGSRARSGVTYRSNFKDVKKYTGVDIQHGEHVDVVADIHTLSQTITEQYDFAFSISVFEHLLMPWVAAVELNSVLIEGGLAFIQSHPTWPLHDEPWDFFRFTKDAWKGLFNEFTGFEIVDTGHGIEASIMPLGVDDDPVFDLEFQRSYLLSCCLVRKISKPKVRWRCDPSLVCDLEYKF